MLPSPEWSAFCHRIRDEYHAGWLPAKHRDVAIAIANLNMAGDWSPTTGKIAVTAGCCDRTVRRARVTLEARGLIAVRARFEIVDGRPRQRANGYSLLVPEGPVVPKPRKVQGGQTVRPSQGSKKTRLLRGRLDDGNRVSVDLLAARRVVMENRMMRI